MMHKTNDNATKNMLIPSVISGGCVTALMVVVARTKERGWSDVRLVHIDINRT